VAPHFFTTQSWKLGSRRTEVTEEQSWAEVADAMGCGAAVVRLRQVHGRTVVTAGRPDQPPAEGDVVITSQPHLPIAVQAADCVPLIAADPRQRVVAAAHAGWRGMAAGVPLVTVEALASRFGCRPEDLIVAAGPSIGACCYEVGPDVREAFLSAGWRRDDVDAWLHRAPVPTIGNPSMPLPPLRVDGWFFDGWACIARQLEQAGVAPARMHLARVCTASHPGALPSYRRDGKRTGRIAGVIRLA
jgi:YfiH family protein